MEKVIRKAGGLALSLALGYLLLFTVLACLRLFYPFELEWIEGAFVDEAQRVLLGYFPYGPPSIFFIPTSKTPLFFYLSAGLMKLFGVGFFAPRLLSVLATLGCFLLLVAIIRHNSGGVRSSRLTALFPGLLAAGIYAASYRFTGAWMDLAKTDSLFLFLILAGFYVGQRARQPLGLVASGGLFALAYFTKQLTLPVVLALAPISLLATRGRSWLQWFAAGATGLAAFWILDVYSAGWFSFYTFDTVSTHAWQPDLWLFWRLFLPKMGPALLLACFFTFLVLRKTLQLRGDTPSGEWECLGLGGALVLASWSIFIKTWTYDNGFMLASLGVSLLAGLGAARILEWGHPRPEPETISSGLPASFKILTLGLFFLQFGLLVYNPVEQLPTATDRSKAEDFVRLVADLPGEVLVFNHAFINHLAGKTAYLHSAPYGDVVGSAARPGSDTAHRREAVLEVFNTALAEQRFDWIVLDKPETSWLPYYVYVSGLSDDSADFYPVTGARTRPESLMAKNPVARGGQLPLDQHLYGGLFSAGWSPPQLDGRWATGERSTIQVALEQGDYRLEIRARPGCADGRPVVREMIAGWNGTRLGGGSFSNCASHTFSFEIGRSQVAEGFNELSFEFNDQLEASGESSLAGQSSGWAAFHSIAFIQK